VFARPGTAFDLVKSAISLFGFALSLIAVFAVLANNWVAGANPQQIITIYYFVLAILLGFLPGMYGLMGLVLLIPLSPNLHGQLNAWFGFTLVAQSNAGIDLAAGFFVGAVFRALFQTFFTRLNYADEDRFNVLKQFLPPWPVALGFLVITESALLAITRNAWQSAAPISLQGVLFNLSYFRPMGWHDDFLPLAEWIAFALALLALISVKVKLYQVQTLHEKNRMIFFPLILGIIVAALVGLIQTRTGIGLLESSLEFRKDRIGFAAQGFQPDIHSFAAHMLLGVIGLWGYWYAFIRGGLGQITPSLLKWIFFLTIGLAWLGLLVSKSRFSFLIAVMTVFIGGLIFLWKNHRRWFYPTVGLLAIGLLAICIILFAYQNQSSFWMIHLISQLQERGFSSLTAVGGIFGDRPEIFSAAMRMFGSFPLMGLGLGDFFRMSGNAEFSQSALLSIRGGENAHNYFLQILTETGLLGSLTLTFALLAPLIFSRHRAPLMPAAIALFAVLLGNVYAHSLLVRENLILAAILMGLMYSIYESESPPKNPAPHAPSLQGFSAKILVALGICCIVVIGAMREIYQSFHSFPFQYGSACFVAKPLTADGWSSGKTMAYALPAGTRGIRLPVDVTRPGLLKQPIAANLQIIGLRWSVLANSDVSWSTAGKNYIEVALPTGQLSDGSIDAVLTLSSCYTPRNQGVSVDGRRLGVMIHKPEFF
jgi:O-antigen ligase